MKKKLYTLAFASLFFLGMTQAQTILYESFDDISGIGNWINSNDGSYSATQSSDAAEGTGSLQLTYNLIGDQGWGGSVDMQMLPSAGAFQDASDAEGVTFKYKVLSPASEVTNVNWNIKLFIMSQGMEEQWHATAQGVIDDASGEWQEAKVPFTNFAIPSWLDTYDGVLYLDQIVKIEMQIVVPEGTTTMGELLVDEMGVYTAGGTSSGTLLESFDIAGNIGNWSNTDGGSYSVSSSTEAVEGEGAVCLFYNLVADQDWGGSIDLQMTPDTTVGFYPDLSEDDGIRWNYKVETPATETNGVSWTVKLFINSTGGQEQWHASLGNILGDDSGEWQEAQLNFSAFAIPSWLETFDGVLYLDSITHIEMQIVTSTLDLQTVGEICLDNLTSFQEDAILYEGHYLNDFENPLGGGVGSWINSTAGSYTLSNSGDAVEGDSSACLSYSIVGDQGWGGSVDMQYIPLNGAPMFQDFTEHLGLSVWYKVTMPVDTPANASFIVKLFNGTEREEWHKTVGGVLNNQEGEWVQMILPFDDFAIPNWLPTVDGILWRDSIMEVQFQIQVPEGSTATGSICFDNLRSYDDEEVTDLEDPPVSVIPVEKANMKIFPNPASTELFIQGIEKYDRIEIFDVNGAAVKVLSNYANTRIDVHDLNNGFYFLKIYSDEKVYSAKFIKH